MRRASLSVVPGRVWFFLPFYGLASLLPLFTTSGRNFEYEAVVLLTGACLLLCPLAALLLPRRLLPPSDASWADGLQLVLSALLPALLAKLAFTSGQCLCNESSYFFWFVVNAGPSWLLAHVLAAMVLHGRRRWGRGRALALVLSVLFCGLASLAMALWVYPQKRITDLFLGFLHGPIYDDWIVVDTGLIWQRAAHALFALGLWWLAWGGGRTRWRQALLLVLGLSSAACWIAARPYASAQHGQDALQRHLAGRWQRGPLTLHFPAQTSATVRAQLIREASFHHQELSALLAASGEELPAVVIYAYASEDDKKIWFGGGGTDVTDVFTPSIHITLTDDGTSYQSLRHELVHALSSGFAYHGLGFHPNMAFTEGLAVALAPSPAAFSLHANAAALLANKKLPPLAELFSPLFWREAGPRAYTAAGSFVEFLRQRHGMAAVRRLYAGEGFATALGDDEASLLTAWQQEIRPFYDPTAQKLYQEALYRDPGILQDRCPHSKAELASAHDASPLMAWRRPRGWQASRDYWPWRRTLDPQDRSLQAGPLLASIKAFAWRDGLPTADMVRGWLKGLESWRTFPPKVLEDAEFALLASDLLQVHDPDASQQLLDELAKVARKSFVGEGLNRQIFARLHLAELGLSAADQKAWRLYLAGWRGLPALTRADAGETSAEPWLLTYLRVRRGQAALTGDLARLRASYEQQPEASLPKSFAREWHRLFADYFASHAAWQDAAVAWGRAAEVATSGQREYDLQQKRLALFALAFE